MFFRCLSPTVRLPDARRALAGLWIAVWCAQSPSAPASPGVVTVRTLGDPAVRGRLHAWTLEGALVLDSTADHQRLTVPTLDVIELRVRPVRVPSEHRPRAYAAPRPGPVEIRLTGGDRLYGRPAPKPDDRSVPDEVVRFETELLGTIDVPLQLIDRWIHRAHGETAVAVPDSALRDAPSPPSEDRLVFTNGDVLHGLLLSIDHRGLTFETDDGPVDFEHARLVEIDLVSDTRRWTRDVQATVVFVDGGRLTTERVGFAEGRLRLGLFGGDAQDVPLERVARVDIVGGRWTWLTELDPISVQHTPMLSLAWPHAADRNVAGGPLRVADRSFEHGIGVHSRSSIMYDLAGRYDWLVTAYGIDDSAGPLADVAAEIHVDGKVRHRQEHVVAGKLWGPVRIDVSGAARIELRVLFGDHAAVQDRFDWIEAGLIRSEGVAQTGGPSNE